MGELGVLPADFARTLAPLAGFRNVMVHEYVALNWDVVYRNLSQLDQLEQFRHLILEWLKDRIV